jgi:predicted enzyme related to lactoylglutathione lyase
MLKFIQTIGVSVSDQDMGDGTRWLVVQPPNSQTGIMLAKGQSAGGKAPGGFTGYVFYTDDIEGTYQTLTGRGVTFTVPPKNEPWAQFTDQDGNEYGLWAAPVGM